MSEKFKMIWVMQVCPNKAKKTKDSRDQQPGFNSEPSGYLSEDQESDMSVMVGYVGFLTIKFQTVRETNIVDRLAMFVTLTVDIEGCRSRMPFIS